MKDGNLDYISSLLLESYKEHIKDASYIGSMKIRLMENENKLDGLFSIFNADDRVRKSFAYRLNVPYEDLTVFLTVLQKV